MTDHSSSHDKAQRSAHGGAWNADPFASGEADGSDNTLVNRPANQAQLATPGAAAESARAWQTQSGAVDFLGLDSEIAGRVQPPPSAPPVNAPTARVAPQRGHAQPAGVPDESWLLEMSEERGVRVPEPQVEAEEASPSPLLNANWQEDVAPKRSRKLTMPLLACAAGVVAVAGVVLMRGKSSNSDELAPSGTPKHASALAQAPAKPAAPGATQPVAAKPEPMAVAHDPAPVELSDVAPTQPSTDLPPIDVAQSTSRERSEVPVPAGSGDASFGSMVDVVPSATRPVSDDNGSEPAFETQVETEADAQVPPPVEPPLDDWNGAPVAPVPVEMHDAHASAPIETHDVHVSIATETPAPAPSAPVASKPTSSVAIAPAPTASEPVAAHPAPSAPAAPVASAQPATSAPVAPAHEPAPTAAPASVVAAVGPTLPSAPAPRASNEPVYGPTAQLSPSEAALSTASNASASTSQQERTSKLDVEQVLLLDQGDSTMRRASAKDLQGVWSEGTVPMDQISSKTKVLTPAVGKVRVVLNGGEIFEGGLYAVGEGCVWIDTQYGRMGLSGTRVKSVAQIDGPKAAPALGTPGSQALTGMERVRIKTPGGVFYGKIIDRDASRTTVVTDDGARLTLDSKDVELLTQTPIVTIKK